MCITYITLYDYTTILIQTIIIIPIYVIQSSIAVNNRSSALIRECKMYTKHRPDE